MSQNPHNPLRSYTAQGVVVVEKVYTLLYKSDVILTFSEIFCAVLSFNRLII